MVVCGSALFAQSKTSFETIYNNDGIKIQVRFTFDSASCIQGNPPISYEYKVKGNYEGSSKYIVWSVVTLSCEGKNQRRYFSEDLASLSGKDKIVVDPLSYTFVCKKLLSQVEIVKVTITDVPRRDVEEIKNLKSTTPNGIKGPDELFKGASATYSVEGGELAIDADWYWYKDINCTIPAGKGGSIKISYQDAGTYYVRAESPNQKTSTANKLITYNKNSKAPTGISGEPEACEGVKVRYEVDGGILGDNAEWAWYSKSCGGKLLKRSTDTYLDYIHLENENLYIRAEGNNYQSACSSLDLKAIPKSKDPISLSASSSLCVGEKLILTVNGKLESGSSWELFEGSCGANSPIQTTTNDIFELTPNYGNHSYYVRASGNCGATNCASFRISVSNPSKLPTAINTDRSFILKNQVIEATQKNGYLSNGANYVWYYGTSERNKTRLGTGSSVFFKPKHSGKLYIGVENDKCKNNSGLSYIDITVNPNHVWGRTFGNEFGYKKFLHIGYNLGLVINGFSEVFPKVSLPNKTINGYQNVYFYGYGVTGGFELNPIYTRNFSLGFGLGLHYGPNLVVNDDSSSFIKFSSYLETTIGAEPLKLYGRFGGSYLEYEFYRQLSASSSSLEVIQAKGYSAYKANMALGIRIGGCRRNDKSKYIGRAIDLYYIANNASYKEFNSSFNNTAVFSGFGIQFWVQNSSKFSFELISSNPQDSYFHSKLDFSRPMFQFNASLQRDYFF